MPYLISLQYGVILLFGAWTLAYHLVLAAALPAAVTPVVWLGLFVPLIVAVVRKNRRDPSIAEGWSTGRLMPRRRRHRTAERSFAMAMMLLGAATGSALLFIGNFNPDDYNFFHRALAQLDHLGEGFFRHETGVTPSGLPQLSVLHVMTSYEPLVALTAHALGVDPLFAYQNGCTFIGALLMVVGFTVLYRTMGINRRLVLLATLGALVFMVLDLRPGRTYGSVLPYLWTGKVLLWGVLLPWSTTLTVRYLRRPLPGRLTVLALAGVCATGLSGSGVFLVPVQILGVSLAYLALRRPNARRLRRVAAANAASAYCLAVGALAVSNGSLTTKAS